MNQAFISRCFSQMPVLLAIAGIAALSALLAKGQQIYEGKTTLEYSLSPVEVVANLSQLADKLKQCCAGEVKSQIQRKSLTQNLPLLFLIMENFPQGF